MKKVIILILSACFFSACSPQFKKFVIDPEFISYYNDFINYGIIYGTDYSPSNLVIEFGDVSQYKTANSNPMGICKKEMEYVGDFGFQKAFFYPRVIVDRASFLSLDNLSRRALIFHELGHCLLNRQHDPSINQFGYVNSLMNPYLVSQRLGALYYFYEAYYIKELFRPDTKMKDDLGHSKITTNNDVIIN